MGRRLSRASLSAARRLEEAQAQYAEALPLFTKAYGVDHPDVIKRGLFDEAGRLLAQARTSMLKTFAAGSGEVREVDATAKKLDEARASRR